MSKELIETIVNGDYVSANKLFEEKLSDIKDKKLYEAKRMVAADIDEAFGGLTRDEIEARKKKGFVKASEVLSDPRDIKIPLRKKEDKKKKRVSEETLDEAGLAPTKVGKLYRTGLKVGGEIGARLGAANLAIQQYKKQKAQQSISQFPSSMHQTQTSSKKERPGIIRRNVNTLMGREAGYVKPEKSPEEKEMQRGGTVGKGLRIAGKGVGKAWGVWGDVLRAGQSGNLEE